MSDPTPEQVERFNGVVNNVEHLLSIARDSELQREAIKLISEVLDEAALWKQEAVQRANEPLANLFLAFECVLKYLAAELDMWLLLKQEQPEQAWDALVSAQMCVADATRAHERFHHLEATARRLALIEELIFPPQSFLSAGIIARSQICSICGGEYGEGDCRHVVGRPYWGEFCYRSLKDISMDHIAMVKNPANKRCRVVSFNVDGGKRNKMTWRIEPDSTITARTDDGAMQCHAALMHVDDVHC